MILQHMSRFKICHVVLAKISPYAFHLQAVFAHLKKVSGDWNYLKFTLHRVMVVLLS